ncbi:hypothetical protein, partial [Nocardia brasiliensis]|uniref:hypothetical protein n=1 Tax=Nocardia brasiliensis TaxID=37326 RepID=UPI0024585720
IDGKQAASLFDSKMAIHTPGLAYSWGWPRPPLPRALGGGRVHCGSCLLHYCRTRGVAEVLIRVPFRIPPFPSKVG